MRETILRNLFGGVIQGLLVVTLLVAISTAAAAQTETTAGATAASAATPVATAASWVHAVKSDHLGVRQMFTQSHIVVKAVIIFLALSSVLTWTVLIEKTLVFSRVRRTNQSFLTTFRQSANAGTLPPAQTSASSAMGRMWAAARAEFDQFKAAHSALPTPHQVDRLLQRLALNAGIVQEQELGRLGTFMGVLATIGSTSPFTGLFGTVWGILHSFAQIAANNTTNLAMVAPGISEALLATAVGLFAAIPAVIIYNKFVRDINGFVGALDNFSAELVNVVSRQLDAAG
ncbi:MotA/TolQ/ExbB proton channel family protein [Georgfuchsia toluolica]|uniref:MotA/TolQ/ExbB proton channel family protein n=1 Tax=Georgfuchsia toluolica TaxID=424218 RepID=A0A916J9D5_9PROT|nr:MotA/TolQ/ExbB proton channel family protein [Georgfuchsia toluolica]CAG4884766.1 MotA/TolQ/ExbB proton channel family protein [Georgfuchsia toluolica]